MTVAEANQQLITLFEQAKNTLNYIERYYESTRDVYSFRRYEFHTMQTDVDRVLNSARANRAQI